MEILNQISELLQKGNAPKVKELVQESLENGVAPQEILNNGLLAGMNVIGDRFKRNEAYVPEVLIAARAMNIGMKVLEPALMSEGVKSIGKVLIGTVKGDLHDIGKNLVIMMMKGAGLEVVDLGVDVPAEKFVERAVEENADIVAMSALLTTTMGQMEEVINEFERKGVKDKFKFMVGGAPINDNFAKQVGADYYTPDAATAAEVARSIVCA
ncbi:corrinoid protein [Haloimpatiens sp. FM7330]|uniref:corrinoid protein n=1 Tax=Haloimpatiens sp. FM7330 TaxID=3298610 RepID=UPI00363262BA